jgi:hypothetical protein
MFRRCPECTLAFAMIYGLNVMRIDMRFFFWPWLAILLLTPQLGSSQTNRLPPTRDSVSLSVLQAIDYAELTRIVTLTMCRRKPELVPRLAACSKIVDVPNAVIEKMALPHFNRYVSPTDAKAALAFWSSPDGAKISKKMLREIAEDSPNLLSEHERQKLGEFNRSEAGVALSRLAGDRAVSQAMIRAIGAYAL